MRKLLGWGLVVAATLCLLPFLPQAWAYVNGYVNLPPANPARYRTVSATVGPYLLQCNVPRTITLKKRVNRPGSYFQCTNNLGEDVTLQWSVVSDGTVDNSYLQITGTQVTTFTAGAGATCASLTLDPQNTTGTRTVYFQGVTSSASPLYLEINFSGSVNIVGGNSPPAADSCP